MLKKKNEAWVNRLRMENYDRLIYVEADVFHFDLVVMESGEKWEAIPSPVLYRMLFDMEPEEMNELPRFELFGVIEVEKVISREKYEEKKFERFVDRLDEKTRSLLTERDRFILEQVERDQLVLEWIKNNDGERVSVDEIFGSIEGGFYRRELTCYNSEELGLGLCHCNNHRPYTTTRISIRDVLDLARQCPNFTHVV